MSSLKKRYSIVDFFETWFQVVPSAIGPILIVSLIALVPGLMFFGLGIGPYFEWISQLLSKESINLQKDFEAFFSSLHGLLPALSFLTLGALLGSLGFFYASLTFQWLLAIRSRQENPNLVSILKAVFPKLFFNGMTAGLLIFLIYSGASLVGFIVIAVIFVVFGIASAVTGPVVMAIAYILAYLIVILLLVGLNNLLTLVQPAVVEGFSASQALSESFQLVSKNFWRALGIRIVISLVVGIASSVVFLMPSFVLFLPSLISSVGLVSNAEHLMDNPQVIFQAISNFAIPAIILAFLNYVFQIITNPVFDLFLYYDLKTRQDSSSEAGLPSSSWSENKSNTDSSVNLPPPEGEQ